MKGLAIILLVIGLIMTVITGFNVITKKKVVDIGPVEVSKEEKTPVYWSPLTGVFLAIVGGSLLIYSRKKG